MTSKRELGIKFNSSYLIANVSLTLVHAHVYVRYVNAVNWWLSQILSKTEKSSLSFSTSFTSVFEALNPK